ncbi:MAG: methylase [Ruminococcus sp.]|jgi:ssDNA-binding Zn-finger/Zn-ribbon topoisomerase 1|nr:methylase [Ruminococcus sp.]
MTDVEQRAAAKAFAEYWKDKGYEKGESQKFWLSLLRDVYGVPHPEQFISFEEQVHLDHTSFIDGYIGATKVLIEQKSLGKSLRSGIRQSDGTLLTPFQQAKRYITELPVSQHPRWVVTCNFSTFHVYDMERPGGEPEEILLENLPTEYYRLSFLTDTGNTHLQREMEVSIQAGEIVGVLYDAFLKQYGNTPTEDELKSLNVLCVRLVFCLYAEDAGIFGRHGMFHDYLAAFDTHNTRKAVIALFQILNTKPCDREKFLEAELAQFPYVNGGLFADERIEVPPFTDEMRELLLNKASADFDWSEISPTIFGAVFESTLNPETRRSGGMHYTSLENIHKVIDPLFLDTLEKELTEICAVGVFKTKEKRLKAFQDKLSSLTFLDPACGSGNFLTETYLSLRKLENTVLFELLQGQIVFDVGSIEESPIKVTIGQFFGIEINDFAVTVAKTALWIAESQMMKATEDIIEKPLDFLPLKSYAHITEGNALRMDWETVVPKDKLNYIMGNPPFVGYSNQNAEQKSDMLKIFDGVKSAGKLDYVCAWYKKAADMMKLSSIKTAYVSTNSITQGEQVAILWKPLFESGIHINFGVQTFRWDSEATEKAAVHCVIVGFSYQTTEQDLNPYLLKAPAVFIENRTKPLCQVPNMTTGNRPADGGHLIIENSDYDDFIMKEPQAKKYIKKLVGSEEFINNKSRYCLWLVGANPSELLKMPLVMERIEACRKDRQNAKDLGRQKLANTPTQFREINNPENYILIPCTSSETRKYVPMGYLTKNEIPTNSVVFIPNASIYHFGILTSNVHMAWMRAVCGRLKSDYRYSKDIVYNNFPWCNPTDNQKQKIEQTAKAILDARAEYPDCSLADLYGEKMYLYPKLLTAHQNNDRAVMQAYGFTTKMTESECVAELMKLYQAKVDEITKPASKK